MKYRQDLVPGVILTALSMIYLILSGQIAVFKGSGATPLDSRFMPRLWGTALLILSLMLVARGLKAKRAETAKTNHDRLRIGKMVIQNREGILSFVMLAIYIFMMKPIGFLISTALYIYVETLILSPKETRNYIKPLIVAIVFACLIDGVFVQFLNVMLPAGLIGF